MKEIKFKLGAKRITIFSFQPGNKFALCSVLVLINYYYLAEYEGALLRSFSLLTFKFMRTVFLFLGLLLSIGALAQSYEPLIEAHHSGSVTFNDITIDTENTLWLSGWQRDNGKAILWRYELDGNLIDSAVFAKNEKQVIFFIEPNADSTIFYGEAKNGSERYNWIACVDADMNLLWEHYQPINYYYITLKYKVYHHKQNTYLFQMDAGTMRITKLNRHYEPVFYKEVDDFCIPIIGATDTTFIFQRGSRCKQTDTLFNVIGSESCGSVSYGVNGDLHAIDSTGYWLTGGYLIEDEFCLQRLSPNFEMEQQYPYFGSWDDDSRFGYLESIAANSDSSLFYAAGVLTEPYNPPVLFSSTQPYPFFVASMNRDTMLWHQQYEDENYYMPVNMAVGPDDYLYLVTTKYKVPSMPSHSGSVVFRISPNGELPVGINNYAKTESLQVYPNPGTDKFTLKNSEMVQGTFTLINSNGTVVLEQHVSGSQEIRTQNLVPGIYFYRLQALDGTLYSGKWVKQ
jgi:hypothetical protein